MAAPKGDDKLIILEGKGTKLSDIPNVSFKLSKTTGRDEVMELFHYLLYRRKGQVHLRKKNILEFSGFVFAADVEEKELEGRKGSLGKWKVDHLSKLAEILDLPKSGSKAVKIDRIMDFLNAPTKLRDEDLAAAVAAKKEKAKRKRERAVAAKEKGGGAKKARKSAEGGKSAQKEKKKAPKKGKTEEEIEYDDTETEEDETSEEEEEEEEEVVPKPKARGGASGGSAKKKKEKEEEDEEMEEEEEEEVVPKPKARGSAGAGTQKKKEKEVAKEEDPAAALSAVQLKEDIETLAGKLTDEELGQLTVKLMLGRLQEHYGFEVRSRKAEIKGLLHAYAESRLPAAEGNDGNGKEEKEEAEPEAMAVDTKEAPVADAAPAAQEAPVDIKAPVAQEAPPEEEIIDPVAAFLS